jgi:hypothetical protein
MPAVPSAVMVWVPKAASWAEDRAVMSEVVKLIISAEVRLAMNFVDHPTTVAVVMLDAIRVALT